MGSIKPAPNKVIVNISSTEQVGRDKYTHSDLSELLGDVTEIEIYDSSVIFTVQVREMGGPATARTKHFNPFQSDLFVCVTYTAFQRVAILVRPALVTRVRAVPEVRCHQTHSVGMTYVGTGEAKKNKRW